MSAPAGKRAEPLGRLVADLCKDSATLGIILSGQRDGEPLTDTARLLVLVNGEWWKRESVELEGAAVEVQFQPLERCQLRIKKQKDAALIRTLYHGKILFDRKGVASKLQQTAVDIYLDGPSPLSRRAQDELRLDLTRRYTEVQEALRRDPLAAQMLMNDLLRLTIEGHFRLNRWWLSPSRYMLAELKRRDPLLYRYCRKCLEEGTAAEKCQWLGRALEQVLRPVGGFLRDVRTPGRSGRRRRFDILLSPLRLVGAALAYLREGHPLPANRFANLLRFASFLSPYKSYFLVITLSSLFITSLTLPLPFLTKVMVDDVLPNRNFSLLRFLLFIGVALTLLRHLLSLGQDYYMAYISQMIKYDIQFKFYRRLFAFPRRFYDEEEIGQIVYRFSDAAAALNIVSDIILKLLNYSAFLLLAPLAILVLDWRLALISSAVIPFYALSYYELSRYIYKYTRSVTFATAAYTAKNYESLSGMRIIQALAVETQLLRRLRKAYLEMRRNIVSLSVVRFSFQRLNATIATLGTFAVAWYAWHQILTGRLSLGDFIAYGLLIGLLLTPVTGLLSLGQEIQRGIVRAGRFFSMYDAQPPTEDLEPALLSKEVHGQVEFRNVSFEYEFGRPILRNVSFTAAPGTTVALVGPSSAGKSTLASLLLGLYEPAGGEVLVDGVDIHHFNLRSLRSQIGFVPQQDFLFEGTIKENIKLGRRWATDQEVEEVAKRCLLHERILCLPQGYETKLGEGGAQFSEGERRQLSLARALIRHPKILILDEALSQLDPVTEGTITSALRQLTPQPTTFIITYRPATIWKVDAVLFLVNGEVRACGPHQELLARNREYREFIEGL